MWTIVQLLAAFAAGSLLIYVGEKDGRAIGVAAFIGALLITLLINGLVLIWGRVRGGRG